MKTILITGGSDGLGKALALKLSKENKVIIPAWKVWQQREDE